MKYIFFILFAAVSLFLILRVPEGLAKFKYLKAYGLGIPATFIAAVVVILLIKASGITPTIQIREFFIAIVLSILTVLLLNCMIIIGSFLIDQILKFHVTHNTANTDKFPVSFVSKNRLTIMSVIKTIFFLGSLLMLYGIWFGNKTIH